MTLLSNFGSKFTLSLKNPHIYIIAYVFVFIVVIAIVSLVHFHPVLVDNSKQSPLKSSPIFHQIMQMRTEASECGLASYFDSKTIDESCELISIEQFILSHALSQSFQSGKYRVYGTEQEALTAVNLATKMKQADNLEKARKLFKHALALQPLHPDIMNHYAEFLEETGEVIKADHLYTRILILCPQHARARINRERTSEIVDKMDQQVLDRIDKKKNELMRWVCNNPSIERMKKEVYFMLIYHSVAIEGNTMSLAEVRGVVETGYSAEGKSIVEHNEVLGLESALRFINKTLIKKEELNVFDILQIHKRVLGHVDPIEAGNFRQTQVYIADCRPPMPENVQHLMEKYVDWLPTVSDLHVVKRAALAHYKFVYIHPFIDGNGRTARLLMNLIFMQKGFPPILVKKEDTSMYFKALQRANEGDIRPFTRFIAYCTESTLNIYLQATGSSMKDVIRTEPKNANKIVL